MGLDVITDRRCEEWKVMVEGISGVEGYNPPSYYALRGPLLQTAKAKVDSALDIWRGEGKRVTGFVLSSDGWEDHSSAEGTHQHCPVNAKGSALCGGNQRIRWNYTPSCAALDCSQLQVISYDIISICLHTPGHTKDAAYIAGL